MKKNSMPLLLTITLLGFGFGFFRPALVFAGDMLLTSQPVAGVGREFRTFPSAAEQKSLYQWIGEARNYSDQIDFSLRLEDNRVSVTLSSEDGDIAAWLQDRFSTGSDSFSGIMPDGRTVGRVDYDISVVGNGVTIEIGSDDTDFVSDLYERLKKSTY